MAKEETKTCKLCDKENMLILLGVPFTTNKEDRKET